MLQPPPDNRVDAQHAFIEVGQGEEGRWNVRAGRQPLVFGDERLVGSDISWDNCSARYDGVRLAMRGAGWRWDLFSAAPVDVNPDRVDRASHAERLSGLYASHTAESGAVFEPYVFWKRFRPVRPDATLPAYDLWTPGVRIAAAAWLGFEVVTEMALQGGRFDSNPVAAWAGYWEVAHKLGGGARAPRVTGSYSVGSGDRNPAGGRVSTFNDLNPAGYNGLGFVDPFAWRNLRDLRIGGDWTLLQWRLNAEFHDYRLQTVADGVYVDGGPFLLCDPQAASARLGSRVLLSAARSFGPHADLAFGYARFFPSEYLRAGFPLAHSGFIAWTLHL
jgi:hypothetical protein